MKVRQRPRRHARRTELKTGASDRIQHPRRHHHDHAGARLDMNEAPRLAVLGVVTAEAPAVERVPAVVDHDILPDMGRMTRRWP
jgi:hypothetical protein